MRLTSPSLPDRALRFFWSLALLVTASPLFAAVQTTVHFDTGTKTLYTSAALTTPLSAGTSAAGDGCVVELGYYSAATTANNFAGGWVALSGASSANSAFQTTSIGDDPTKGAAAGKVAVSLTFVSGSGSTGNNLPPAGTPLALRFYNSNTIAGATAFNIVSNDAWLWQTPLESPSNPILTLSLDDASLEWLGGPGSAFFPSEVISKGVVAFSAASYSFSSATENNSPNVLFVTLARTAGSSGAVAVQVSVTGGTLLNGTDYTFSSPATVTFADSVTQASVQVPLAGLYETGSITLALGNPTGGLALGTQTNATVNVTSPGVLTPGAVSFSAATYGTTKLNGTPTTLTVTAQRTGGTSGNVSAQVAVTGGTATPTTDFTLAPVVLSWAAGDSADKTFDITIPANAQIAAGGETILLGFQSFTGLAVAGTQSSATVTILPAVIVPPTVTLTSPTAGQSITAAVATFSGQANSNLTISRVEVSLNGAAAQLAILSPTATGADWTLNARPAQGANTVTVTAFDSTASAPVTRSFSFNYLESGVAGSYNGLLVADAQAPAPLTRNGLLSITTTKTGSFTGSVKLNGASFTVKGLFEAGGNAVFGTLKTPRLELAKGTGLSKVSYGFLSLTINNSGIGRISGVLEDLAATTTFATCVAQKAIYSAALTLPATMLRVPADIYNKVSDKGRYTSIFQSKFDSGLTTNHGLAASAFPQGDGYGTFKVSTAGIVKIAGKLADGTAFSYSNRLSGLNSWPFYIALYAKKGYLTGNVLFDSNQTQSDASCENFTWVRPANALTKLYSAGWPGSVSVDFWAARFIPTSKPTAAVPVPPNANTVFGPTVAGVVSPAVNLHVTLTDGGLPAPTSNDASLSAVNKLTVVGATSGATSAAGLKATFVNASGAFSGSFVHPLSLKVLTLRGVVYQKNQTAAGYFIYTPLTAATPPAIAESGFVGMAPL